MNSASDTTKTFAEAPSLSSRLVESQNEVLQLVISGAPLSQVLNRLIATVEREAEGNAVASILLLDPVTQRLQHGAAPSLPDSYNHAIDGLAIAAEDGTFAASAARNETVITPNFESAPGWQALKQLPLSLGLRAAWSIPIRSSEGAVIGTFGTYFRTCRAPTESEIEIVTILAKTAALAIERHQSEERLRQAVRETRQQQRLYETVLSNTPDLVYVFNLQHRFTFANQALFTLWDKTAEQAIGKNCLELGYEPWHAEMHSREIEKVIATRQPIRGEVAFNGTNGHRCYDYIFAPVIGANGEVEAIAGTARDVTDQRKAVTAPSFLGDLAQRLAAISDEKEIIHQAVSAVGRYFEVHRCYFLECRESANLLHVSENWVRDDAPSLAGTFRLYDFGGPEWWREYSKGNFAVDDTETHPLTAKKADNYAAAGVRAYAVQAVQRTGDWTVVMAVTENQPRHWTGDELRLLENVAARVWLLVERARSEAALRVARDQALAAARAKDDFIAALSHELRTPLNPVLLLASAEAQNPTLAPETRADFETIARHVTLEAHLIDDLLELTRITHDKLATAMNVRDLHLLIHEVVGALQPELNEKKLTLNTHYGAPSAAVVGDEARLRQIFWNLLKNAVKFTPTGEITIATSHSATKSNVLKIEVSDTGIGLTGDELAHVFKPFVQGAHREQGGSTYGGLGLGLAISRKIVELHSGSITAQSPGRNLGAHFIVELPLAPAKRLRPAPAPETPAPAENPEPLTRRRVLLVEDHEPSRVALARLLAKREIEVVQASSAEEALEKAASHTFNLVISDIGLPGENGYQLMHTLRAKYDVPGIAISGYGTADDILRSKEAGFSVHLTKPVQIQQLNQALAECARP
jgi:PAS domain S-box-containing protein